MRKFLFIAVLIPLLSFSMAEPAGAPPEVKNISIVVIDKEGKKHQLKSPTCEGLSYIKVRKGQVEYSISFTNIEKLEILNVSGDKAMVKIKLKSGKEDIFDMPSHAFCTALSEIGNASFTMKDIKEIIFHKEER